MFDSSTSAEDWLNQPEDGDLLFRLTEQALQEWLASDDRPGSQSSLPHLVRTEEPGLVLAASLAEVDVRDLSGSDRVAVMQACQRMASHYQAKLYESMASVADAVIESLGEAADDEPGLAEQAAATEIRAALHLTRKAADGELGVARGFQRRLPDVWEALASGRIDRRRANLILHQTGHLTAAAAREVSRRALEKAPELTTGQLTALLKRLSLEENPADAKIRYEAAIEDRRVVVEPTIDGTANLHLYDISPETAMDISKRIDAAARQLKTADETRTMDQLRADVATDLLLSSEGGRLDSGRHGGVTITTTLSTLAGLTEHPGDLSGYGPVISDIARQVTEQARDGSWTFTVTDGDGRPKFTGVTRRRPTASQQRQVESEYPTCVFPGCRMPASDCDLDHRETWAEGGATEPGNLAPLCRHDHRMRHEAGWQYQRNDEGDHRWSSPLGEQYVTSARAP